MCEPAQKEARAGGKGARDGGGGEKRKEREEERGQNTVVEEEGSGSWKHIHAHKPLSYKCFGH